MLDYIKGKLIENPDKIQELLEFYGFANVHIRNKYISFGRDEESSRQGITLYIEENEALLVKDWSHNQCKDIFNYIITVKGTDFKSVINKTKSLLGINECNYDYEKPSLAFGGFYNKIKKKSNLELKVYDESILDNYDKHGNKKFLEDGISLEVQKEYEIGFSIENQAITIPIRNEFGEIIGIKCRSNHEVGEDEQKYWYDVPCLMSQTLYNYSESYQYLEGAEIVYIVEAEKGTLQASTLGYKNVVSLGSGSISKKQCQLLLQLNCKKIVFLHDTGYEKEYVFRNIMTLKTYAKYKDIEIGYWDNFDKEYEDKLSATDMPDRFEYILENEIKYYDREMDNSGRMDK